MTLPLPLGGPAGDRPFSVTEVVTAAKEVLESAVPPLWVVGEVSGLKRYPSGHWYFTLKDAGSQLRCVMWRADAARVRGAPADGQR